MIKFVLFLSTLSVLATSLDFQIPSPTAQHDPLFEEAMKMWQNYNSEATDLVKLYNLLENSAAKNQNPAAMAKLGEFWLFGLPVSQQSQYDELPEFIVETPSGMKFKRNYAKAVEYFTQSRNTNGGDSEFYLAWMLQQTMITSVFDDLHFEYEDKPSEIAHLYDLALKQRSFLAQTTKLKRHTAWNIESLKDINMNPSSKSTIQFFELPILQWSSCDEIVDTAMQLATKSQQFMNHNEVQVSRFDRSYYDEEPEIEIPRQLLENLAQAGDETAGMKLANGKLHGDPDLKIERNSTEAVQLFEKVASETGNANSHEILGVLYSKGVGVEVDVTKAIDHLLIASACGLPGAFNTFGYILNQGVGDVPRNQTKATSYMNKAAELGSIEAIANLGELHLSGDGVKKDVEKATEYFRLAAKGGHIGSAFNLGMLMYNDIEAQYDCNDVVQMFGEVHKESDIDRFMQFAHSFFESGDYEGAYLNYALAANLGFSNAGLNLSYMFENDMIDYICSQESTFCQKAFLLQTVHLSGSKHALVRLGDFYYAEDEPKLAFAYYSAASAHPKGLYCQGSMHAMGVGTPKNYTAAQECFFAIIDGVWQREFDWRTSVPAAAGLLALYVSWPIHWILNR